MAPVSPAAAAPAIAPAVFLRSDLRVSPLFSAEDSTALRLDETNFLRTFATRHLTRTGFLQDTHMRYPAQGFPHAANHTPTAIFPQSCVRAGSGPDSERRTYRVGSEKKRQSVADGPSSCVGNRELLLGYNL